MSEKKRTSISVDKDVYHFLKQNQINQSGLINELVKEYRDNQDRQVAALELRYQHLIEERDKAREKAENKDSQAQDVKELLEDAKNSEHERLEEAKHALRNLPDESLHADNPGVKNWAGKLGWEPETLLEELDRT